MNSRKLGNTGLLSSEASLGTAEIGIDYGFKGSSNYSRPTVQNSIRLIQSSINQGVNWLDTARAYGNSEEIIGQYLNEHIDKTWFIITKVSGAKDKIYDQLYQSIDKLGINTASNNVTFEVHPIENLVNYHFKYSCIPSVKCENASILKTS